MPVKTPILTEQEIRNVPMPNHGARYTVIPHAFIIDKTKAELANAGFDIKSEIYRGTLDGEIAQGIYHLNYGTDPDMGLMFAWSNSYNRMQRFKCSVGGYVFVCMNGVLSGDMSNYSRKHVGSALYDAEQTIIQQISKAKEYYDILVADKEALKDKILSPKEKGTILGRLFAEQEILTLTQVGIVKREMDKPTFHYNCSPDSAWAFYNHITCALKESHPKTYFNDHQCLHEFFIAEYGPQNGGTYQVEITDNDDMFSSNTEEQPVMIEEETVMQTVVKDESDIVESTFGVTFL